MLRRLSVIAVVALAATFCAVPATAATISVGPYVVSTVVPFVVPIRVSGAAELASFTFDLAYDPSSFVVNTACDPFGGDAYCDFVTGPVTAGPFYGGTTFPALFNPGFVLLNAMGAQIGSLLAVNGAWQDPGPAPSGDGILAYIEFIAVAGGSATSPITVVGPAVVSEPSTVALAFAALGWLTLQRRRRRS